MQDAGPPWSRKAHPWSKREPPSSHHPSAAAFMTRTWPKGLRPVRCRTQHTGPRRDRAGLKQLLRCPESCSTPKNAWPSFSRDTRSKIPARIKSEEHHSTYVRSVERVWEMPFAVLRIRSAWKSSRGNSTILIPSNLFTHLPDAGAVFFLCEPPTRPSSRAEGRCTTHRGEKLPVG